MAGILLSVFGRAACIFMHFGDTAGSRCSIGFSIVFALDLHEDGGDDGILATADMLIDGIPASGCDEQQSGEDDAYFIQYFVHSLEKIQFIANIQKNGCFVC